MIVSTRLRQTDKRLRKIHSINNNNNIQGEKSENFNHEEKWEVYFNFVCFRKNTRGNKSTDSFKTTYGNFST